jgi:hypothetical protein
MDKEQSEGAKLMEYHNISDEDLLGQLKQPVVKELFKRVLMYEDERVLELAKRIDSLEMKLEMERKQNARQMEAIKRVAQGVTAGKAEKTANDARRRRAEAMERRMK